MTISPKIKKAKKLVDKMAISQKVKKLAEKLKKRGVLAVSVAADPELDSIAHAAKGYPYGFEESVRANLKKSRTWGWCCANVSVRFKSKKGPKALVGNAYLGHCSYLSKQDFIDGCYYQQLVDDATIELVVNLQLHIDKLVSSIDEIRKLEYFTDLDLLN